jgi:NAD dependent epimerase/dehydratase
MNKNVFITGADGFIGSHLTEKLVEKGYNVKALSQYNSFNSLGWLENLSSTIKNNLEIVSGDVRDNFQMNKLIKKSDVVFHLASLIGIPYSYQAPQSYIDTNVTGTLNVIQSALDANVSRVIHTSTSEVYGSAEFVPIPENHPLKGQSPYSASKIAADQLALSYYYSFQLPLTICRPFNTYGPRQSLRAVIPTIITQLLKNNREINLGELSTTRDFNYVEDTVNGFMACMLSNKAIGEVINVGSNFEISIEDTAKLISNLLGVDLNIKQDLSRIRPQGSEVNRLWADNSKAIQMLDWKPKFSGVKGFKDGILKTINWFKDKDNIKLYKNFLSYNI